MTLEKDLLLGFVQMFCLVALAVIVISVVVRQQVAGIKEQVLNNNKMLREINKKVSYLNNNQRLNLEAESYGDYEDEDSLEEDDDDDISPDVKLYVGNIDYSVTEKELKELFAKFGEVEMVNIPVHRHSGKTRGFGFITFGEVESASKALSMNGSEFKGRSLQINYAKSKAQ